MRKQVMPLAPLTPLTLFNSLTPLNLLIPSQILCSPVTNRPTSRVAEHSHKTPTMPQQQPKSASDTLCVTALHIKTKGCGGAGEWAKGKGCGWNRDYAGVEGCSEAGKQLWQKRYR